MSGIASPTDAIAPSALGRSSVGYIVDVADDWRPVAEWGQGAGTVFQNPLWLSTWFGTLNGRQGVSPLLVTVRAPDGTLALRLPLVLRRMGRRRAIEFADLDLTDFNAPLLGPAAPTGPSEARALWRAVRRALPPADFIRLTKLPTRLGTRPNPLAMLPGAQASNVNGNLLRIGNDYDGWRRTLEKTVRKELERSWRVFTRDPDARFEMVRDLDRARVILTAMEQQQSDRLRTKGEAYALDDPDFADFYRALVENGLSNGYTMLSALTAGDEVVATLLGVRDAHGLVMVRISNAGGRWINCSPGRLVIERTLRELHAEGCRVFDFSIGNYDYKRRFGVEAVELVNVVQPLRIGGWPVFVRSLISRELRRHPRLEQKVRPWIEWVSAWTRRSPS